MTGWCSGMAGGNRKGMKPMARIVYNDDMDESDTICPLCGHFEPCWCRVVRGTDEDEDTHLPDYPEGEELVLGEDRRGHDG